MPTPLTGTKLALTSNLKVGIMAMDDMITPMPPLARTIAWARKGFESRPKVDVKSFISYRACELLDLARRLFTPDGGVSVLGYPVHGRVRSESTEYSGLRQSTHHHSDVFAMERGIPFHNLITCGFQLLWHLMKYNRPAGCDLSDGRQDALPVWRRCRSISR